MEKSSALRREIQSADNLIIPSAWDLLNELHAEHDAVRILLDAISDRASALEGETATSDQVDMIDTLIECARRRLREVDAAVDRLFDIERQRRVLPAEVQS